MRKYYWMYGSGSWKEVFMAFCAMVIILVMAIFCAVCSGELVHCQHCEKLIHYTSHDCEFCGVILDIAPNVVDME